MLSLPNQSCEFRQFRGCQRYEHNYWIIDCSNWQGKNPESSYQFDESVLDPRFFGFCGYTMFNMPPGGFHDGNL